VGRREGTAKKGWARKKAEIALIEWSDHLTSTVPPASSSSAGKAAVLLTVSQLCARDPAEHALSYL
jgi:hypothetical protein